jgi:nitroimidazol reductase NimA-like FMN-containing flavoprotein (pyridoxamine 5'-phosphate oxidase superfamily)
MLDKVIEILRDNRLASLATVDIDGWPHCTMVGIASAGTRIYFVVAQNSQKLTDIERDDRVSLAIGRDVIDPSSIRALAIKARAQVVDDPAEKREAIRLLLEKRPALKRLLDPQEIGASVIVAVPDEIRLLDYSAGYGNSALIKLDVKGSVQSVDEQIHDWGYGSSFKSVV